MARHCVLDQLHDFTKTGVHFALHMTLDGTGHWFWWPTMQRDIDHWIKSFKSCEARSTAGRNLTVELQPVTVGLRFAKMAAENMGPVTCNRDTGNKYNWLISDYFTKYLVTVPIAAISAADMAKALGEKWALRFGVPDTEQESTFCSELMTEVWTLLNIETPTFPYNPQRIETRERQSRVLADVINEYGSENPRDCTCTATFLYVEFAYNRSFRKSTGETPIWLVFGNETVYTIDLQCLQFTDTLNF